MTGSKPFIFLFTTPGGYYCYDINTNTILTLEKDVYNFLQDLQNSPERSEVDDDSSQAQKIRKLQEDGFLSAKRMSKVVHPMEGVVEFFLKKKLAMITLQVTQQCNLRCEYCVYSGAYDNRGHSGKKMSFDTARKAIDFLIENSSDSEEISVGFYGGEPLLEFDLVKRCMEYAEEKAEGKKLLFAMTTNGTLLDKEKANFLSKRKISILISLDGPKHVHDKNRKFVSKDAGSFDKLMENVEYIKNHFPEMFNTMSFNAVLDPENDFSCLSDFFMSYETVKDSYIRSQFFSDGYSFELDSEKAEKFNTEYSYEKFKLYLAQLGKIDYASVSKVVIDQYTSLQYIMHKYRKPTASLPDIGCPSGGCNIGVSRLFVSTEGILFPCERVSESSPVMRIGSLDEGFYVEHIKELLNLGKLTEKNCINCWASRFCYLCLNHADGGDRLSAEKRLSCCREMKVSIVNQLKDYCVLKEMGHDFGDTAVVIK